MGQVGLHAITGLAVGEYVLSRRIRDATARRALLYGFVFGNIIPDLDFIAVAAMYPVNQTIAMHLHRGFSHSLLAAGALAVGFQWAALLMRDEDLRWMGYGLALGIASHFVEDIFIWFSPVDVFWPASIMGIIPPVNLWWWWTTPDMVGKLLGAAEFLAFALYYDYLVRLARSYETDWDFYPTVSTMSTACWILWAVVSALALDLPETTFSVWLYVPMDIVFMPACLYITWRMQDTIQALGRQKQKSEP